MNETLALATTEELINELLGRYESAVLVVSERPQNNAKRKNDGYIQAFYGGMLSSALGLLILGQEILVEQSSDDPDDEEEA